MQKNLHNLYVSESVQPAREKNDLQLTKPLACFFFVVVAVWFFCMFFVRPWAPSAQQNASEACT